jgi:hypothetical protein
MSRHKKSEETSKNDGRKYNKRLAPKPISTKDKMIKPARTTKAKKDRIASYSVSAMKEVFGSEKDAFIHMAELAKKNFNQMKLLMEYAYGKPSDSINSDSKKKAKSAPTINFVMNNQQPQIDNTIDIDTEE